jgi:hypothetical protein
LCQEGPRPSGITSIRLVVHPMDIMVPAIWTLCGSARCFPLVGARQAQEVSGLAQFAMLSASAPFVTKAPVYNLRQLRPG